MIEFDEEVNRLLHTVTYILSDYAKAERKKHEADKEFYDSQVRIQGQIALAKNEILELIRIKAIEDNNKK